MSTCFVILGRFLKIMFSNRWRKSCQNSAVPVCVSHMNYMHVQQDYIHKDPVTLHDNLSASLTNLTVLLQSHCSQHTNTGISTARNAETHRPARTLPACDISLCSLTLPEPEAWDCVELLSLYMAQLSSIRITAVYCLCDPSSLHTTCQFTSIATNETVNIYLSLCTL